MGIHRSSVPVLSNIWSASGFTKDLTCLEKEFVKYYYIASYFLSKFHQTVCQCSAMPLVFSDLGCKPWLAINFLHLNLLLLPLLFTAKIQLPAVINLEGATDLPIRVPCTLLISGHLAPLDIYRQKLAQYARALSNPSLSRRNASRAQCREPGRRLKISH